MSRLIIFALLTDHICPVHLCLVQEFLEWCERLHTYLQTLENRLFSEGLHVLGAPPSNSQMAQYLGAYYGDSLPQEAVDVLAEGRGVDAARTALEAAWKQVGCGAGWMVRLVLLLDFVRVIC
jgi:cobalamin biosynthesis Mg chelatase CobN